MTLPAHNAARWALFATTASVMTALLLAGAKAVAWQMSGSVAILGSLADSLLDLLSSIIAFIGVRMASQPADENHRFGHQKAEAVSSLVQLVLITGSAVFVLVESGRRFLVPQEIEQTQLALGVMLFSIIMTALLVTIQTIAVRQSGSIATESDRAHYIGDFLGNAGTIFAVILASQYDILRADAAAGLVASAFLFWSVWEIGCKAMPQLMDEELAEEDRLRIQQIALEDRHVRGIHALRTRRAGTTPYIQLHLELDPEMSLREAHLIADEAQRRLLKAYPGADILIHQDVYGNVETHDQYGRMIIEDEQPS